MSDRRVGDSPCGTAEVVVEAARCTGCGLCARACPCGAIELVGGLPAFHCRETCTHSTACVAVAVGIAPCAETCPVEAIRLVFEIVLDDRGSVRADSGARGEDSTG